MVAMAGASRGGARMCCSDRERIAVGKWRANRKLPRGFHCSGGGRGLVAGVHRGSAFAARTGGAAPDVNSAALLSALIARLPVAAILLDSDGRVADINPAAAKLALLCGKVNRLCLRCARPKSCPRCGRRLQHRASIAPNMSSAFR